MPGVRNLEWRYRMNLSRVIRYGGLACVVAALCVLVLANLLMLSESVTLLAGRALVEVLLIWFVALLALPLLGRERQREPGCCDACGYDLAGLAADRCPECGEEVR